MDPLSPIMKNPLPRPEIPDDAQVGPSGLTEAQHRSRFDAEHVEDMHLFFKKELPALIIFEFSYISWV